MLPMKFAASVSLAALALASCATVPPADAPLAPRAPRGIEAEQARTPEGAREFIAMVEKDLFDLSVIGSRAGWVNATYLNDDTDALAAYFGTISTEKGVKYALQAAKWAQVPGLDPDTARKLNTCAGRWCSRLRLRQEPRPSSTPSPPGSSRPTARAAPA